MKYSEERKSEASIAKVSSILCEWDPIGVIVDPTEPNDEYDNYILAITMQLDKSTDENELVILLKEIANSYMCVSTSSTDNLIISKKLISHWKQYAL